MWIGALAPTNVTFVAAKAATLTWFDDIEHVMLFLLFLVLCIGDFVLPTVA